MSIEFDTYILKFFPMCIIPFQNLSSETTPDIHKGVKSFQFTRNSLGLYLFSQTESG